MSELGSSTLRLTLDLDDEPSIRFTLCRGTPQRLLSGLYSSVSWTLDLRLQAPPFRHRREARAGRVRPPTRIDRSDLRVELERRTRLRSGEPEAVGF
jgi:hypothetical protein